MFVCLGCLNQYPNSCLSVPTKSPEKMDPCQLFPGNVTIVGSSYQSSNGPHKTVGGLI